MFWNVHRSTHQDLSISWEEQIFASILIPHLNGKSVLDVGCGDGVFSNYLYRKGASVLGVDFSEERIKMAKTNFKENKNLCFINGDLRGIYLPYRFDIICGKAILHEIGIEDTPKVIAFFKGHLKKNGYAVFQENSYFNPVFRFIRKNIVGKYGVPKVGSIDEMPFDTARFNLYRQNFRYCIRSTEVFVLFQRFFSQFFQINGLSLLGTKIDQKITTSHLGDDLKGFWSYSQHIYLSDQVPKCDISSL